ncbi:cell surface protein [Actinomyces sp. MRS3W]|uniref:cell surface protein n=1 Tax=Actinomyces sp. MRS3W TaxID=2800796 RepID=UPI0028FD775D|nr:cell surface protein [Actinomyces sp. MRS3W]MDU0348933.1 cell surface protein [Actinomyces sp. MRS3W]
MLILLDLSACCFYALWFIADNAAANRAERYGLDLQQLLPNGNLMWLFANAMLVCLVILNALLIVGWRRQRYRRHERPHLHNPLVEEDAGT